MQSRLTTTDVLLVDTFATGSLHKPVINIGLEIAAKTLNADVCSWREKVDIEKYDTIAFNIAYTTYLLNVPPFLIRNGIDPLKERRRSHLIIAGGPGISNCKALDGIADFVFKGEIDALPLIPLQGGLVHRMNAIHSNGWSWKKDLDTEPILKNGRTIVEITRGCKYSCHFCEYGCVTGGPYREKPLDLIEAQLAHIKNKATIELRTANLAGYSRIEELSQACKRLGVKVRWPDLTIVDAHRAIDSFKDLGMKHVRFGIESLDEPTRKRVGKGFSDDLLLDTIEKYSEFVHHIHLCLIYGLPDDDYDAWFSAAQALGRLRRTSRFPLRFDFSLTNLHPAPNTPLENAPPIDFAAKDAFLKEWIRTLRTEGFYKLSWNPKPGKDFGLFGRKELHTSFLRALARADSSSTGAVLDALPFGVGRSISDAQAAAFLGRL